jgi:hypothetical protein
MVRPEILVIKRPPLNCATSIAGMGTPVEGNCPSQLPRIDPKVNLVLRVFAKGNYSVTLDGKLDSGEDQFISRKDRGDVPPDLRRILQEVTAVDCSIGVIRIVRWAQAFE